jgi:hypothetical protein
MMDKDRRVCELQPRKEKERGLSDQQLTALRSFEQNGWELRFVRRPPQDEPVPVMFDVDTGRYAVLEKDGALNKEHGLTIRSD